MDHQYNQQHDIFSSPQLALPNATAILVLGILSIVLCFICGIVALVLSAGDRRLYQQEPHIYTSGSYELVRAGRICSIIGLCLWGAFILLYIGIFIFAFSVAGFNN